VALESNSGSEIVRGWGRSLSGGSLPGRSRLTALLCLWAVPRRPAERSGGSTNPLCARRRINYNWVTDLPAV
jgi:hypothetical protein